MPYYEKSEDWLHQSSLLLQARPATTRITTRYHIKPARRVPKNLSKKTESTEPSTTTTTSSTTTTTTTKDAASASASDSAPATKPPRGHLVLKTYDPQSGVTLKYKTSKAAEVTRLIQMLGTLGRGMAALPPAAEEDKKARDQQGDVEMLDVGGDEKVVNKSGTATPVPGQAGSGLGQGQQGQQQGAGGAGGGGGQGKKKKKGKK